MELRLTILSAPPAKRTQSGSWNYRLMYDAAPAAEQESDWRWCNKCQGLFYGPGVNNSKCPAGETHATGGWNYSLRFNVGSLTGWQSDWRWCSKCQGLHFAPNIADSHCAAGGAHEIREGNSANYSLLYTT